MESNASGVFSVFFGRWSRDTTAAPARANGFVIARVKLAAPSAALISLPCKLIPALTSSMIIRLGSASRSSCSQVVVASRCDGDAKCRCLAIT